MYGNTEENRGWGKFVNSMVTSAPGKNSIKNLK